MELFIELFITGTFLYCVYQLGAIAGMFSEKSGVVNVAIEGNMIIGASLFGTIWMLFPDTFTHDNIKLITAMLSAVILSAIYMQLLSLFTNRYMGDHVIVGTGLNMIAPAIGIVLWVSFVQDKKQIDMSAAYSHWIVYYKTYTAVNTLAFWMLGLTLVILFGSAFYLNETKGGLRLRSSGENPYSLETAGVSVRKTRRHAIFIAGLISGLAGTVFMMYNTTFNFTVTGSGFISLAILIMSGYRLKWTTVYSVALAAFITIFGSWLRISPSSTINPDVMLAIPFILPLIGLLVFKNHSAPAAIGKNFNKSQR